jgi:hypothetical protein
MFLRLSDRLGTKEIWSVTGYGVAANYDLASNLAELVSDYVEYGKSKAKSAELAERLEVPGS